MKSNLNYCCDKVSDKQKSNKISSSLQEILSDNLRSRTLKASELKSSEPNKWKLMEWMTIYCLIFSLTCPSKQNKASRRETIDNEGLRVHSNQAKQPQPSSIGQTCILPATLRKSQRNRCSEASSINITLGSRHIMTLSFQGYARHIIQGFSNTASEKWAMMHADF